MFCREAWFVPNLLLAERHALYEPALYLEIARRFKRGIQPQRKDRCLFITRKDAPSRRLLNEDEVFATLRGAYPDLERVSLTGMSLQDQITLFAEARLVAGSAGQAFCNLLFCEGALCIQLVPGYRAPEDIFHVWAANQDRLGLIHGNRCLSHYSDQRYHEGDWTFPLEVLKKALKHLESLGEAGAR